MKVKDIWTDNDFELMSWHDSHIHSITFPNDNLKMILDIDYLFKWELNDKQSFYNFWVSPSLLIFLNVLNFKIELDFKDAIGLDINTIKRSNSRLSPNEKKTIWDYIIETDKGIIAFEATEYIQKIKRQPIFSDSQMLPREEL